MKQFIQKFSQINIVDAEQKYISMISN